MNKKNTLVFFGSGPVAAESLRLLAESFQIEAIITKPTTEREMRISCPGTPLFTVSNKAELDLLIDKESFTSTVSVLIDFGIIVSQKVIDAFPKGIVNSHFSLLPELRGADPISFAILEGRKNTGVSLMLLVRAMDEGPLIGQVSYTIEKSETTPSLTEILIELSAKSLVELLPLWIDGSIDSAPQEQVTISESKKTSYTRKLTKEDGVIDWSKPAVQIDREVRAYLGWPKSRTSLGPIDAVITDVEVINLAGTPGSLFIHEKKLGIHCGTDSIVINSLVPAGKKQMDSIAFLAGYKSRLGL